MRSALKLIGLVLLLVVLYVGGVLLYGSVTDWQPSGIVPNDARARPP